MSKPDFNAIAERLADLCRESRLGVEQKAHNYNMDNSRSICVLEIRRELRDAFTAGECKGADDERERQESDRLQREERA